MAVWKPPTPAGVGTASPMTLTATTTNACPRSRRSVERPGKDDQLGADEQPQAEAPGGDLEEARGAAEDREPVHEVTEEALEPRPPPGRERAGSAARWRRSAGAAAARPPRPPPRARGPPAPAARCSSSRCCAGSRWPLDGDGEGEEDQHRGAVEQPLGEDRGQRRGRRDAGPGAEQQRPHQLPGARRQDGGGREPGGGAARRGPTPAVPAGRRISPQRSARRAYDSSDRSTAAVTQRGSTAELVAHLGQRRPPQEVREQRPGQHDAGGDLATAGRPLPSDSIAGEHSPPQRPARERRRWPRPANRGSMPPLVYGRLAPAPQRSRRSGGSSRPSIPG